MIQSVNFLEIVKNRNKLTLIRTPGPPSGSAHEEVPPEPLSLTCITYAFKQGGGGKCLHFNHLQRIPV